MDKASKILITGSGGMVGSSIKRNLNELGFKNLLTPRKKELDLTNGPDTEEFFKKNQPDYVFLSAAKVGGIHANMTYKADFIYENLMMQSNCLHLCHKYGVKKLVFISSGCVYPKNSDNPIKENSILTGELESSNEHYSIAKIAGIKMCEAYFKQYGLKYCCVIPNNIYGPFDNYHPENSHVMAALLQKIYKAKINNLKEVEIWGSGNQMREFVFVEDVASACIHLISSDHVGSFNCSSEVEISIKQLANLIKKIVGYKGNLFFNTNKPEGHFRKSFSCSKLKSTGWQHLVDLDEGINQSLQWYIKNVY